MQKKLILTIFLLSLITITQVHAGFFDPIIDPIQNFLENLRDSIEEELERSRVGRELNRIVDDLESVARIVRDFDDLAALVAAVSTPAGIADLAIQYGHDPDKLFDRFQERVENLENAHPGGGSGSGGQLSNNELAAALQSVLEEPSLPDGVYLGDPCIIDLTGCPDGSTASLARAHYWAQSCYVEGVLTKKKINGLYRAVCENSWHNTWNGNTAVVQFPYDQQFANYEWQQCAQVLLTDQDKDQFLGSRDQVCSQRIGYHEIGEICVVDYTSCGYGAYGNLNANRIGTITYGAIPGQRNEFACEITYGNYALNRNLRDSCSSVYVSDREVDEFLALHPEPVQAPAPVRVKNTTPNPVSVPAVPRTTSIVPGLFQAAAQVTFTGINEDPVPVVSHFARNGTVVDVVPPALATKKVNALNKLNKYNVNVTPQIISIDEPLPAPKVLPGNPLHFFKSIGQKARLTFTFDTERKAELKIRYANEKLLEAKILEKEGKLELVQETVRKYQEDVVELEEIAVSVPSIRERVRIDKARSEEITRISLRKEISDDEQKVVEKIEIKEGDSEIKIKRVIVNDSVVKEKIVIKEKDDDEIDLAKEKEEQKLRDLKKKEDLEADKAKEEALLKELEEKRKAEEDALKEEEEAKKKEEAEKEDQAKEEEKKQEEADKQEEDNSDSDAADEVKDECVDIGDAYVCGTDGVTYTNYCYADLAKIKISYKGKCVEKDSADGK